MKESLYVHGLFELNFFLRKIRGEIKKKQIIGVVGEEFKWIKSFTILQTHLPSFRCTVKAVKISKV